MLIKIPRTALIKLILREEVMSMMHLVVIKGLPISFSQITIFIFFINRAIYIVSVMECVNHREKYVKWCYNGYVIS